MTRLRTPRGLPKPFRPDPPVLFENPLGSITDRKSFTEGLRKVRGLAFLKHGFFLLLPLFTKKTSFIPT